MICPKCNAEIDNHFKTCPECGAAFELPPGTVFGDIRIRRKKSGIVKTEADKKRTKRRILIGFGIFLVLFILLEILDQTGVLSRAVDDLIWWIHRMRFQTR